MHDDELDIDVGLVARLIDQQFPEWSGQAIAPVVPGGTDNAMFRLGEDKVVRLPRIERAVGQVEKDQRWLPVLAPRLPCAIPELLAAGVPSSAYPWTWGVYRFRDGDTLPADRVGEALHAEIDLARFLRALRQIDTRGAPSSSRGGGLAARDEPVRRALIELGDEIDGDAARRIWRTALQAPGWQGPPTWLHGDLMPGNLLFADRRLSAVIDFWSSAWAIRQPT